MSYKIPLVDDASGARRLADPAEVTTGANSLAAVLAVGADANAVTIANLGAPSASTDADTKGARDTAIAAALALGFHDASGGNYAVAAGDYFVQFDDTNGRTCTLPSPATPRVVIVGTRVGNTDHLTLAVTGGALVKDLAGNTVTQIAVASLDNTKICAAMFVACGTFWTAFIIARAVTGSGELS